MRTIARDGDQVLPYLTRVSAANPATTRKEHGIMNAIGKYIFIWSLSIAGCAVEPDEQLAPHDSDDALHLQSTGPLWTGKVPFEGAQPVDPAVVRPDSLVDSAFPAGTAFGPFQIVAAHSNRCLDVTGGPGAVGNGAFVQQWGCFASFPGNQLWWLVDTGDADSWYIVADHSAKCLDVRGGTAATGNGPRVQQWDCLGYNQSNQRWILESDGNIRAAHSGRCLDVKGGPPATGNGAAVQQWGCFSPATLNQRWSLH